MAFRKFLQKASRSSSDPLKTCLRAVHLYLCSESADEQIIRLDQPPSEVTNVVLGVRGVALYGRGTSSRVWFHSSSKRVPLTPQLTQGVRKVSVQWDCLELPKEELVTSVSIGRTHIIALADSHRVYAAGDNSFGQCGYHGDTNNGELVQIQALTSPVKQIACGLDHSLFLTQSGEITSCGWSADGQTGTGRYDNVYNPTLLDVSAVTSVHTCGDSCFALTESGGVVVWGNNEYGQLGIATEDQQVCSPVQLDLSKLDSKVISIATGGAFTAVLTSSGSVYVAGYTVEDPSLCVDRGKTVIIPERLSKFRKLEADTKFDFVCAGLNYLVAGCHGDTTVPRDLYVWGRCPGGSHTVQMTVDQNVNQVCFGPTELASIIDIREPTTLSDIRPLLYNKLS